MNKQEFLAQLRSKLAGIPHNDIEERINFYGEMIDDRMEEGLTEEQAIEQLGTIDSIVKQIMSEIPLTKLVKEKVKPGRTLSAWEIILLILGSPIWFSLLIALFSVVISLYAVVLSLIVTLWAIDIAVIACAVSGIFSFAVFLGQGAIVPGILTLGGGILCAGLAIFGFFGCKYATVGILKLTKRIFTGIKSCFMKKEANR